MPQRVWRAFITITLILITVRGSSVAWSGGDFPRPIAIEPNVEFWVNVFTAYTERDFIIHDKDQVWRVYQVMHLPGEGTPSRVDMNSINDYLKDKYTNILNRLAAGGQPSNYDERHVAELFRGEPPAAYSLAAQNMRVQEGMRERFEEGLLRSRNYRPTMERIFRTEGLPPELVALAEVESGFQTGARSSAGAVGIWQFTRDTGREYMRITRYHDDRLDPTASTEAAASLLRANYDRLGSWPLAITAYNYGTGGMAMASDEFEGDFNRIFRGFNGAHFGFASKNYYAEFLAALQIHEYENQYFPDLKYQETPEPPIIRTDFTPPPTHHYTRYARTAGVHRVMAHRVHRYRRRHRVVASATRRPGAHVIAVHAKSIRHRSRQEIASGNDPDPA
jgi:membrane-bound lytic murein transglycosylase D